MCRTRREWDGRQTCKKRHYTVYKDTLLQVESPKKLLNHNAIEKYNNNKKKGRWVEYVEEDLRWLGVRLSLIHIYNTTNTCKQFPYVTDIFGATTSGHTMFLACYRSQTLSLQPGCLLLTSWSCEDWDKYTFTLLKKAAAMSSGASPHTDFAVLCIENQSIV